MRLVVGYGFMAHGYAKIVKHPDAFAGILHALGVPAPHFMAWATIVIELVGGLAVIAGQWVSEELRALMVRSRQETAADAQRKAALCSSLQINTAAMANEGFMIHRPRLDQLLDVLLQSKSDRIGDGPLTQWTFVSNRSSTRNTLTSIGAQRARLTGSHKIPSNTWGSLINII
nr:DoxX family protein [Pararobbsia alpina]